MSLINKWYKQRAEGRQVRPPQNEQDYSYVKELDGKPHTLVGGSSLSIQKFKTTTQELFDEITESVKGGLRTTTYFPQRTFLSLEEQIEIAKQAKDEIRKFLQSS